MSREIIVHNDCFYFVVFFEFYRTTTSVCAFGIQRLCGGLLSPPPSHRDPCPGPSPRISPPPSFCGERTSLTSPLISRPSGPDPGPTKIRFFSVPPHLPNRSGGFQNCVFSRQIFFAAFLFDFLLAFRQNFDMQDPRVLF